MREFCISCLICCFWRRSGPISNTVGVRAASIPIFSSCGVGAGVINVAVKMALDPHGLPDRHSFPTIGASGAIYGVLLANAVFSPTAVFGCFPSCNSIHEDFVAIMIAIEFFGTLGASGDNVSHICHLGRNAGGLHLSEAGILPLQLSQYLFRLEAAAAAEEVRSVPAGPQ